MALFKAFEAEILHELVEIDTGFQSIYVNSPMYIAERVYVLPLYKFIFTVPAVPRSCNITLLYDQSSQRLQFIDTTWDLIPVCHTTGFAVFLFRSEVCTYYTSKQC